MQLSKLLVNPTYVYRRFEWEVADRSMYFNFVNNCSVPGTEMREKTKFIFLCTIFLLCTKFQMFIFSGI